MTDTNLKKKHLKKIENEPLYSHNGLIVYTYNDGVHEKGYYNPGVMNIGDYIQSLAARQFLPKVDELIDRDQLGLYQGRNINMIMNAWYYIWKKNEVFSENIHPLFVAFHLNNTENISQKTISYLKKNEPIGCRDYQTKKFLQEHDIEAYFSGCLTLTLGMTYKVKEEERNDKIYFVDYKMGSEKNKSIDREIKNILKEYPKSRIFYKTHKYPLNKNPKGSLYEAEQLIKDYAKARLVITENIHCALPCLSLGTPVILVLPTFDCKRFRGIVELFNYIGINEQNKFEINITRNQDGKLINKSNYLEYANYLEEICKKFTGNKTLTFKGCEKNNFQDHQEDSRSYKQKIFHKEKCGNKRKITLFGFIKITYTKRKKK